MTGDKARPVTPELVRQVCRVETAEETPPSAGGGGVRGSALAPPPGDHTPPPRTQLPLGPRPSPQTPPLPRELICWHPPGVTRD